MVELPDGLHGAYPRGELARLIGRSQVRAAVCDGRLRSFAHGVVINSRRSHELLTRAAAAVLLTRNRGLLCGSTCLELHGYTSSPESPIHVLVPYSAHVRKRPGLMVHQTRNVEALEPLEVCGLPTVPIEYAIAEVLCRGDRWAALASTDQALAALRQHERPEFWAAINEHILQRPDSRGRRRGRLLLELATGLPESPSESWLLVVLTDGGLPMPVPQYRIVDPHGREIWRLDFAWPDLLIAIEYDGYAVHLGRVEFDNARDEDLRRRGWTVIRASSQDLRSPAVLISSVKEAFARRGVVL